MLRECFPCGDHDFTFLIEDPATIWNLGPQRYPQTAERYRPLTPRQNKLAIDINVVERYQDVYPTKQQTGTELFELVHQASVAFPRVALYFENSIPKIDWPLLAAAASTVDHAESEGGRLVVHALRSAGVQWSGPALVDGHLWPFRRNSYAGGRAECAAFPAPRLQWRTDFRLPLPPIPSSSPIAAAAALSPSWSARRRA